MKQMKRVLAVILTAMLFAVSLSSCSSLLPTEENIMPPPISKPEAADYNTVPVTLGDIQEEKYCVGSFTSTEIETISFNLDAGIFYQYHVKKGELVKKGDLLAEAENVGIAEKVDALEETIYRNKLTNDLQLANMKTNLNRSTKANTELKNNVANIKAEYEDIVRELDLLIADLNAKNALISDDTITQEEIDRQVAEAQAAVDAKEAEVNQKGAEVKKLTEELQESNENLALQQQEYNVKKTLIGLDEKNNQKALNEVKSQLNETQIFAPFDGKITYLAGLVIGDPINKDVPILTIADPDSLQFQYEMKESEESVLADALFAGREVEINMNNSISVKGVITQGPANVPDGVKRDVDQRMTYIEVKDVPEGISLGSVGSMVIVLKEEHDVIVVESALVSKANIHDGEIAGTCYVLQDGLPVLRNVQIGLQTTAYVEITDGLKVGEELVTNFK